LPKGASRLKLRERGADTKGVSVSFSGHLRGIVIAGVLAALALVLGFMTLAMNQPASSAATPHRVLPLKLRHQRSALARTAARAKAKPTASAAAPAKAKPVAKPKPKPRPNVNFLAAKKAGLPTSIARALASRPVAVVTLSSTDDPVARLATAEAKAGAALAGASFRLVSVDRDGGDVEVLTRLLGALPASPATLVYTRPATLLTTLPGFNDRTVVQQAAASARGVAAASVAAASVAAASTAAASTAAASTAAASTAAASTSAAPTSAGSTTAAPTTAAPTSAAPTSAGSTAAASTSAASTTATSTTAR
jgi:hypothetical protein